MSRRKSSSVEYPKKSRCVSFVGKEGHEAVELFDKFGERYPYGKSGLVIDLIKIYQDAVELYGDSDAMFRLRMNIELEKRAAK